MDEYEVDLEVKPEEEQPVDEAEVKSPSSSKNQADADLTRDQLIMKLQNINIRLRTKLKELNQQADKALNLKSVNQNS